MSPPTVLERVEAIDPGVVGATQPVEVVLGVVVDVEGRASKVESIVSGGEAYDRAAADAVKLWRFRPALRDGKSIAAKIRVPFSFPAHPELERTKAVGVESASPLVSNQKISTQGARAPLRILPVETAPPSEVTVHGGSAPPARGGSDFRIEVGRLAEVPRKNSAELLQLAPGILLTNEGGEGHAQQIFLRGFDAREGQDLEISVDGVPVNEAGNLHGNGHAETNFIIPETVLSLRVLEGPFDPRQGNFAVAGSADYHLGLQQRGATVKLSAGSYGTRRLLALWGPAGFSRHTFGAAEISSTDGFGQNRDATRAAAVGQYEGALGDDGSYRLVAQGYSTNYGSAGVLRADDYEQRRVSFYDTYDRRQGGDAARYSVAFDLDQKTPQALYREQVYVIRRDMRLISNFTGYLLDVQEPAQTPHRQRGDGSDLSVNSWTLGSRGSSRVDRELGGLNQSVELGYSARGDFGAGTHLRLQSNNGVPYHRDVDVEYALGDIGLFVDASLRPLSFVTLRGGLRANHFSYNVLNNCAQQEVRQGSRSSPPGDDSCLDQQDLGLYRDETQRSSTASSAFLPRASILFNPAIGLQLSMAYGRGVRSMDPIYISQDLKASFAMIDAYEAGAQYSHTFDIGAFAGRVVAFRTHVNQDLIFSETEGRNTLADGTTRTGALGAVRWTGEFFDQNMNATLVQSKFDDTGLAIPYVPNLVLRSDTALHRELPLKPLGKTMEVSAGVGVTYVGRRPLPYDQMSDPIFTMDASMSLNWHRAEVTLELTNLMNRHYRLGEYNYASNFQSSEELPTLVPVRHFAAGAPRMFLVSVAYTFGGSEL